LLRAETHDEAQCLSRRLAWIQTHLGAMTFT
jgi:hypothetical protein